MASTSPHERWPAPEDDELLPSNYDQLIPIDRLTQDRHNPSVAQPSDGLRRSVATEGLQHALVVHRPESADMYQITDGWQRYQAAVDAGWEQLPVRVHETAIKTLQHSERESLGKAYLTYHWARFCQSVALELDEVSLHGDSSMHKVAQQVAARVHNAPSVQTIKRYLRVLSLPTEIHLLLIDGPEGTESDWQALRNYNIKVRRYRGLPWVVAHHLAKHHEDIEDARTIGAAAWAVCFDDREKAKEFVQMAAESPDLGLELILKQMHLAGSGDGRLIVPRVVVSLSPEQKQTLIEHAHQTRTPLPAIVEQQIKQFVGEITDE